jgi:dihydrofolate reductase
MYGSTTLMQTLIQHDLIDEYRIWVHPLVLGSGKRLFPENGHRAGLKLKETKTRSSGVVGLIFEPS